MREPACLSPILMVKGKGIGIFIAYIPLEKQVERRRTLFPDVCRR